MLKYFAVKSCYGHTLFVQRGHNFEMVESTDKRNVSCTSKHYVDYICLVEYQLHQNCESTCRLLRACVTLYID